MCWVILLYLKRRGYDNLFYKKDQKGCILTIKKKDNTKKNEEKIPSGKIYGLLN